MNKSSRLSRFHTWLNDRIPVQKAWDDHLAKYYAPKNFNFWYYFGVFSLLVLVNQIVTGIFLAMVYTPTDAEAFNSVEHIMRNVEYGWLIRYMHSTGASAFFVVIYLHMYRGLIYGSYRAPRELVWLIGMAIYFLLVFEAFTGYVLPWGQMSFWGAKVITSLLEAIPVYGTDMAVWFRGDYNITGVTLNRFFALHVVAVPILILILVFLHIIALHHVGSNNPDGIEIKEKKDANGIPLDGIPFFPYYVIKDLVGIAVFLMVFCAVIFFYPTFGGYFLEPDNFTEANNLKTPEHIAPVWYLTPYYAILRAIPDKMLGFFAMDAAIAIMFVLPWLDRSPVKSIRYKGIYSKIALVIFVISFVVLGYLGLMPATPERTILARIFSVTYFAFFLLMPFYSKWDQCKPVPERVT